CSLLFFIGFLSGIKLVMIELYLGCAVNPILQLFWVKFVFHRLRSSRPASVLIRLVVINELWPLLSLLIDRIDLANAHGTILRGFDPTRRETSRSIIRISGSISLRSIGFLSNSALQVASSKIK